MTAPAISDRAGGREAGASGGFNPIIVAALLVVGLAAAVSFFAGQAFDSGPRLDFDGRAHAASKSAVGYAAAVELLRATGRPTVVAKGPILNSTAVLVVTLDGGPGPSVFETPLIRNHNGPVLVVLPKWATSMDDRRLNWVRKNGLLPATVDEWLRLPADEEDEGLGNDGPAPGVAKSAEEALRGAIREARLAKAPPDPTKVSVQRAAPGREALYVLHDDGASSLLAQTAHIDQPQTFQYAPGWKPMIVDQAGRAVMIAAPDRPYFVLAEPDVMNTHGLSSLDNARAMTSVLDQMFGPDASYVFDVTSHGITRSRSFLRQAFEPPFLAATICAVAGVVLMGWHAFFRFGAPARPGLTFALGKRALADNQADLIKMTGREHRMGGPYGALVRDRVARSVGAPRDLSPDEVDALLDRMGDGGRTSWPLSTLRRDIEQAKDPAELVRAAERLHHWKLEMTRERQ